MRSESRSRHAGHAAGPWVSAALLVGALSCQGGPEPGPDPSADEDVIVVQLCDGETTLRIPDPHGDPERGREVAATMLAVWQSKHPGATWEMPEAEARERAAHQIRPASENGHLRIDGQAEGHLYGGATPADLLLWKRETERLVVEGSRVFHSSAELGSTLAVSCDMCHPDGSNTHPETYPKYQVQRGEVSLLRDMINWCLENPVRGTKLSADDPKMRALEAYVLAQRSGKVMEYGKH